MKKLAWKLPVAIGALLVAAALVLTAWVVHDALVNGSPNPSPASGSAAVADAASDDGGGSSADGDGFPSVDWDYWLSVNPDIVGWVTVPGTPVNHPIVQAGQVDPTFYLDHGADGSFSSYGCPYLAWYCAEGGLLGSGNAIVFGHHMSDGGMFAAFADFADPAYAAAHSPVLVQTPDGAKAELSVVAVERVDATTATVDEEPLDGLEHMVTFVTCSYTTWTNERTLVHCSIDLK